MIPFVAEVERRKNQDSARGKGGFDRWSGGRWNDSGGKGGATDAPVTWVR